MAGFLGRVVDHEGNPLGKRRSGSWSSPAGSSATPRRTKTVASPFAPSIRGSTKSPPRRKSTERAGDGGAPHRTQTNREYWLVPAVSPAMAAFRRGIAAFDEGNFEEAAKAFEKTVDLAPQTVEGHANLAADLRPHRTGRGCAGGAPEGDGARARLVRPTGPAERPT